MLYILSKQSYSILFDLVMYFLEKIPIIIPYCFIQQTPLCIYIYEYHVSGWSEFKLFFSSKRCELWNIFLWPAQYKLG